MNERGLVLLACAVVFEVAWALLLKPSRGFTVAWATTALLIAYLLSLFFLNLACRHFQVSVAYAVWTGCGAVLIAFAARLLFDEPLTLMKSAGVVLIVAGIGLLAHEV